MRNSWAPRVVALVTLLVFSLSDVAFGVPVCPAPGNNKTSPGTQVSLIRRRCAFFLTSTPDFFTLHRTKK